MTNAGKTGLSKNGKFLVTAAAALSAGFLAPMNHVKTGTANADTDVKANQNVYTVKAGDTLTKIARETGVDLETLAQQVQDENVIMVNQKLTLVQKEATVVDGTKIADLKYNANADANGDKFMSVSEYNNWVNNGRPEAAAPASNAATTEASSTNNNVAVDGTNIADLQYNANADANGDGFMSADEYNNWVNNGRPEAAAPASNAATTEASSTNNNVVVDGTNVADLQYNANADTDGDGFMSVDEYNNWVNNGRPEAAPTSDAATTEATATNNNVVVDGTNIADLQYNANADTDGDGFMSVDEYNNWVNNGRPEAAAPASDVATTETPATNNNVAVDGTNIADLQYNANADANGDGFMSVDEYNNWVNNGRPEAAAPASDVATTETPATNNNVAVDGTNIADLQYNANADANGDGFMSVDEYNNWVNNGRPEAAAPAENTPAANNNQASNNNAGNSTATAGSYADAMNAMNSLRASYGLAPVSYDGGLAATASMRAAMLAGGLDSAHFSQTYGYEVVAIQFGSGAGVISAWYNETNMIGAPGHRNWLLNPSIRYVGFGYDANTATFVGEAR